MLCLLGKKSIFPYSGIFLSVWNTDNYKFNMTLEYYFPHQISELSEDIGKKTPAYYLLTTHCTILERVGP